MADNQDPKPLENSPPPPLPSSSSSSNSRVAGQIGSNSSSTAGGYSSGSHYPNPPDATNPDPAKLREQWRFAIRQYSRWYAHAWGTAILAGISFFALGWIIKGSNPLPSFKRESDAEGDRRDSSGERDVPSTPVPPPLTSSPSDAFQR